jgi:hypothetical protein
VKTISYKEKDLLLKIIGNVFTHMNLKLDSVNQSFLSLPMGIFQIKLEGFKRVNVLVMRNAINQLNLRNTIRFKFDLKGSMLARSTLSKTLTKA